jgi:hypothetical protein
MIQMLNHQMYETGPFNNISSIKCGYVSISTDCVFDASLVPGTCPNRFVESRELINKFMESSASPKVSLFAGLPSGTTQDERNMMDS